MNRPNRYQPIHKALRGALQIRPVRRGRFELQIGCRIDLQERDSAA